MKKAAIFFLTVFLLLSSPTAAFAGNGVPAVPFGSVAAEEAKEYAPFEFVTGETDDFQPQNEYSITFSNKISIIAESVMGAKVRLSVTSGEEPFLLTEEYEEVVIGPSLKYIQPVSLELGDNLVTITVEAEGYEDAVIEAVVKRKDGMILESLQKLIVIPVKIK